MSAQSSTAETTEAPLDRPPSRTRAVKMSGRKKAVVFGALLLVVALVVAGLLIWRAADQRAEARADAAALDAGKKEIATMTAIDHQSTDAVLNRWLGATTGGLHETLTNSGNKLMSSIAHGKLNTSGKVLQAKVTRMDREAGTASLIANVEVTLSYQGIATTKKQDPIQANLALDGAQWKLSSMSGTGSPLR